MHKSPGFAHIIIVMLLFTGALAAIVLISGYQKNVMTSTSSNTPEATASVVEDGDLATYVNDKFGITFQYPSRLEVEDSDSKDISWLEIEIGNNCMDIGSYSSTTLNEIDDSDHPISKYIEHKDLAVGETKTVTYSESELNSANFTLSTSAKRLQDKNIGGYMWFQLELTNNFENHGNVPLYYLEKDSRYWYIASTSGATCSDDEIRVILDSISFTNNE